jgi:hypothetical protein
MMPAEEEKPDRPPQSLLALYGPLAEYGDAQIRLHRAEMYNRICSADDQLLVTHSAYGIAAGRQPVLHLRRAGESDLCRHLPRRLRSNLRRRRNRDR